MVRLMPPADRNELDRLAGSLGLDALLARVWQELALKGGKEPISQGALPS